MSNGHKQNYCKPALTIEQQINLLVSRGLTPEQVAQHQKYFWDNAHNRNTVSTNFLTTQDVSIQKMFALIGRGEQAGSGADKIRTGWRLNRWRAPKLESHDRPSRVELVLPMVSLIPEETLAHLRAMLGVAIDSLTSSELKALATAELENSVSNIRLQELLPDHSVEISRMLTRLCERGLLVSDNWRRWATYRLGAGDKLPSLFDQTDSSLLNGDSSHLAGDSSHLKEVYVDFKSLQSRYPAEGKRQFLLSEK